ncbi:MAG: Nif3-like dinuclear metal center hexameric protein [Prolixibacteraceae bacterium]
MKIKEIIAVIEEVAPVSLQESWDNSGLIVGNASAEVESALITLDVTEAVLDDAIQFGEKLIIAHHPLIFSGLKKLNGKSDVERAVIKAIKNDIAIYAAHTNIDVVKDGVSWMMARKLGLTNVSTLIPQEGLLKKLVTFVPVSEAEKVKEALFMAGAGHIGNYDSCAFSVIGTGSFRGNEDSKPFAGKAGQLHFEEEQRVETIFPAYLQSRVITALLKAHPYEEVAYDIYVLENEHPEIGLGVLGDLPSSMNPMEFLQMVKSTFHCEAIRYTTSPCTKVTKVALVGGSGSSYLKNAMAANADIFITGDFKYHQFFDAENRIMIADIGHFESEQFTKELFYEIVTNKFSKFALRLSEVKTNPINYLF